MHDIYHAARWLWILGLSVITYPGALVTSAPASECSGFPFPSCCHELLPWEEGWLWPPGSCSAFIYSDQHQAQGCFPAAVPPLDLFQ